MLSEGHINTCEHATSLYLVVRNFMAHLLVIFLISTFIGLRTDELSEFHRKLKFIGYISYEICLLCGFLRLFQFCNHKFCISHLSHANASEKFNIWSYIPQVSHDLVQTQWRYEFSDFRFAISSKKCITSIPHMQHIDFFWWPSKVRQLETRKSDGGQNSKYDKKIRHKILITPI